MATRSIPLVPDEIKGFILAGGKSSRMGRRKADLTLGGNSLMGRAADAIAPISGGRITVIGVARDDPSDRAVLADPEMTVDGERASGAIVGLYGALSAASSEWIAVIACDLPFVNGGLFTRLATHRDPEIDAIVPMQADGRPQPLAALYRSSTCGPAALLAINGGDRSMRALLLAVNTKFIPFSAFSDLAEAGYLFLNVNTPDDFRRAAEHA